MNKLKNPAAAGFLVIKKNINTLNHNPQRAWLKVVSTIDLCIYDFHSVIIVMFG